MGTLNILKISTHILINKVYTIPINISTAFSGTFKADFKIDMEEQRTKNCQDYFEEKS